MKNKTTSPVTLDQLKDQYIGAIGSPAREEYEYELRMEVLGKMIRATRKQRNLSQEELGRLVGVQKAQISKPESSANSATIDTILKVFNAMRAEILFQVKIEDAIVKI